MGIRPHQTVFSNTHSPALADLFDAVQLGRVFSDSKAFTDAVPKMDPNRIAKAYELGVVQKNFDLHRFVLEHFEMPTNIDAPYEENTQRPIREHVDQLWDVLIRPPDRPQEYSSLISLPNSYIVPGGRFSEVYYWDCYFAMLGYVDSKGTSVLKSMTDNMAHLIDTIGFVPNGNRTYFCTRSQPPMFPFMVELLALEESDPDIILHYLPQMEREYAFWMRGADQLSREGEAAFHVVRMNGGTLNRYWDDSDQPRPESYAEDIHIAQGLPANATAKLYRNIRAACESGWDFTSRWCDDPEDLRTTDTTNILPVDLNCLMHRFEVLLAHAHELLGNSQLQEIYIEKAAWRKSCIQKSFFDDNTGFFADVGIENFTIRSQVSLAGMFPLFLNVATPLQAASAAKVVNDKFLRPGGWVTTLNTTDQQWDAPNGWAPLQWATYKGLVNYGYKQHAEEGARRWIANNLDVYKKTGKLLEKYNVEQPGKIATGGEYDVQHGFGWTNGVLIKLMNELNL